MLKGKNPCPQAGIVSSGASSLVYPDHSFKYSPKFPPAQPQSKLHLFNVTTTILQQSSAAATTLEAFNKLANGSMVHTPDVSTKDRLARKDFPKNISDFGLFQNCQKGRSPNPSNQMYAVSEEVGQSDLEELDCDGEEQEQPLNGGSTGPGERSSCQEEKEEEQKKQSDEDEITLSREDL